MSPSFFKMKGAVIYCKDCVFEASAIIKILLPTISLNLHVEPFGYLWQVVSNIHCMYRDKSVLWKKIQVCLSRYKYPEPDILLPLSSSLNNGLFRFVI